MDNGISFFSPKNKNTLDNELYIMFDIILQKLSNIERILYDQRPINYSRPNEDSITTDSKSPTKSNTSKEKNPQEKT